MISVRDFYHVMTAMVPLYVAMILAYGSVRWWRIFTPDQCSGINRFVALFAVPLLSFHFISTNDPYAMNLRFIAADTLQKIIVLAVLFLWACLSRRGSLEWTITLFSLSTLPNTLVMGIPLLKGMYGDSSGYSSGSLMVQIVVLQCIIWYTLMLFLFEYRGAKLLITEQFPDTAGSIVSIAVDSDVVSLDGRDVLQTDAEVKEDGKLHVTVRRSSASRSDIYSRRSQATPRPSNLTNAEIYSLQSSRNPTPRGSSFNHMDFYSMIAAGRNSNFGPAEPRPSNYEEEIISSGSGAGIGGAAAAKPRFHYHGGLQVAAGNYPAPNPGMFSPSGTASKSISNANTMTGSGAAVGTVAKRPNGGALATARSEETAVKDLHMFVWSSSASPVSDVFGNAEYSGGGIDAGVKETIIGISQGKVEGHGDNHHHHHQGEYLVRDEFSFANRAGIEKEGQEGDGHGKIGSGGGEKGKTLPPASVMTRLILIMVWRKLIRNPNTYSSLIGLTWSLVSFRWNVQMPAIVEKSISILSDAGLGMAMFSLGLFMALQPRIIACGNSIAAFAMAVRFLAGPAVMAAASLVVGLRGALLHIAIVQAALPQGIVPFVFAKEYNLHPDILSTAVIFGMLIALPITLVYYILLGL